eukprot:1157778-Pelagomonas_calceolata.AAC.10
MRRARARNMRSMGMPAKERVPGAHSQTGYKPKWELPLCVSHKAGALQDAEGRERRWMVGHWSCREGDVGVAAAGIGTGGGGAGGGGEGAGGGGGGGMVGVVVCEKSWLGLGATKEDRGGRVCCNGGGWRGTPGENAAGCCTGAAPPAHPCPGTPEDGLGAAVCCDCDDANAMGGAANGGGASTFPATPLDAERKVGGDNDGGMDSGATEGGGGAAAAEGTAGALVVAAAAVNCAAMDDVSPCTEAAPPAPCLPPLLMDCTPPSPTPPYTLPADVTTPLPPAPPCTKTLPLAPALVGTGCGLPGRPCAAAAMGVDA